MPTILHQIVRQSPELMPLTREKYLRDLNTWVAFAGSNPKGWTRYRAQEFYSELLGHMKPQSANRLMSSVRYASSWWAKKESRPELDFAVIQLAQGTRAQKRDAMTPDEVALLLATCASSSPLDLRDRAMIIVGLETGMRRMSLIGMQLEAIKVCREGYPVCPVPLKGDGEELFNVPLSDTALEALAPWREWLRTQKVTKGPVFRSLTKRIATTGKNRGHNIYLVGDSLSERGLYAIVAGRATAAGLEHIHPHIFRHTFITWRTQAGFQPHQVASITGHKIANIPGLGGLGHYIDAARIAKDVRRATPPWLAGLVRKT